MHRFDNIRSKIADTCAPVRARSGGSVRCVNRQPRQLRRTGGRVQSQLQNLRNESATRAHHWRPPFVSSVPERFLRSQVRLLRRWEARWFKFYFNAIDTCKKTPSLTKPVSYFCRMTHKNTSNIGFAFAEYDFDVIFYYGSYVSLHR